MAITEPVTWDSDCTDSTWFSFGNCTYGWNPPADDGDTLEAKRKWSRKSLREWIKWQFNIVIKPLILVFKRYDFRGTPRWSTRRWKAKT